MLTLPTETAAFWTRLLGTVAMGALRSGARRSRAGRANWATSAGSQVFARMPGGGYVGEYVGECVGEYVSEYVGGRVGEYVGEYVGGRVARWCHALVIPMIPMSMIPTEAPRGVVAGIDGGRCDGGGVEGE